MHNIADRQKMTLTNFRFTKHSHNRLKIILIGVFATNLFLLINSVFLYGQAASRQEEIEQKRADKKALLHPEKTTVPTKLFNKLIDLGLIEESGYDPIKRGSSLKVKLGGMRSGSGQTLGIGYGYNGLWQKRLNFEVSARGTRKKAFMFDLEIDLPGFHAGRGEWSLYAKYENSPSMNYFGPGPDSNLSNRTSFRLEDTGVDIEGRYRLMDNLYLGGSIGGYFPNVGRGQRSSVPSTEEIFDPQMTPGLDHQADFLRTGTFLQLDYLDMPEAPRAGGNYIAKYSHYRDLSLDRHDFNYLHAAMEHYIPYWNKTRVVALYMGGWFNWTREDQVVPFYLQPTLGGSKFLRGFERYRFRDHNAILMSIEHRWHLYAGGFGALFFEAGKVAPEPSELSLSELEYSGGIGFRFTIRDEVVIRVDNAVSREGYRLIWTFSDLW